METANQIVSLGTFQVLKVPLGFIRLLEWLPPKRVKGPVQFMESRQIDFFVSYMGYFIFCMGYPVRSQSQSWGPHALHILGFFRLEHI
ncbi:hypothetical protein MHYP_G00267100 [Metynnis hypsauchen]